MGGSSCPLLLVSKVVVGPTSPTNEADDNWGLTKYRIYLLACLIFVYSVHLNGRINANLRHYLERLCRRTRAFSKCIMALHRAVRLFVWFYNRRQRIALARDLSKHQRCCLASPCMVSHSRIPTDSTICRDPNFD